MKKTTKSNPKFKKAIDLFKKYDIMYFVRMGDDGFFHGNKLPYTVVY